MDTFDRMLIIQFAININEDIAMERVALLRLTEPLPSLLHTSFRRGE
jgi:hypothetical protein